MKKKQVVLNLFFKNSIFLHKNLHSYNFSSTRNLLKKRTLNFALTEVCPENIPSCQVKIKPLSVRKNTNWSKSKLKNQVDRSTNKRWKSFRKRVNDRFCLDRIFEEEWQILEKMFAWGIHTFGNFFGGLMCFWRWVLTFFECSWTNMKILH